MPIMERIRNARRTEGGTATMIERQTAKLPSDTFLWAAGASIVGSAVLQALGRKHDAQFVGQWAPTFLILGLYNKIVKVLGHDVERGHPDEERAMGGMEAGMTGQAGASAESFGPAEFGGEYRP